MVYIRLDPLAGQPSMLHQDRLFRAAGRAALYWVFFVKMASRYRHTHQACDILLQREIAARDIRPVATCSFRCAGFSSPREICIYRAVL